MFCVDTDQSVGHYQRSLIDSVCLFVCLFSFCFFFFQLLALKRVRGVEMDVLASVVFGICFVFVFSVSLTQYVSSILFLVCCLDDPRRFEGKYRFYFFTSLLLERVHSKRKCSSIRIGVA